MKGGFIEPDLIVDIKAIKGLGEIAQSASGFSIGAAVPCAALGEMAALKQAWPGVVEASSLIGSRQVQGRCTIAGNLCNASPAADSVPALVAAGAKAVIVGAEGTRTIAVEDVPTGPGRTSLAKGEIVRHQIIWRDWGRRLAECRARLLVDVKRRACGAASADVRWFVA
jgi:carbon-monoxide dehydrogenase medium subunit